VRQTWNLLEKLGIRAIPYQTSMYTDDLILLTRSEEQDLQLLGSTVGSFADQPSALLPINRRLDHL
jgi:hypothetical protein